MATFMVFQRDFVFFFSDLLDRDYCNQNLDREQYLEVIKTKGTPEYDEYFGYVPLLGLGGLERVENLQRVKLKEHIFLITEFMGAIG